MATIFNRSTNVFCVGLLSEFSDDASRSAEALSDTRTMLPEERKPCQILGRCFLKRGSPVRHSDDASWSAEALSDARTILPEARKLCQTLRRSFPRKGSTVRRKNKMICCDFMVNFIYLSMFNLKNERTMKKVKNFSLTNLRTEENFGFQMDVKALAESLPTTGDLDAESLPEASVAILTEAVNGHTAAVTALDDALKDSASVPSSTLAAEAEQGRDGAWRGLNNYVKAMTAYPEGTVAAEALAAKALIDKYGDPTDKPQTEESGILHNLIQDLENGKEGAFPNLQVDVWVTDLKNKNQRFLDFSKMRTEEEAARQVGIVKEKILLVNEAYRKLIDTVNAMVLLNGEAKFASFIDQMNILIDRQKTVLKARATNSAKKSDEGVIKF